MVIKFDGLPLKCMSLILTVYDLTHWSSTVHFSAERNNRIFGLFVRNGDIRMFSSQ